MWGQWMRQGLKGILSAVHSTAITLHLKHPVSILQSSQKARVREKARAGRVPHLNCSPTENTFLFNITMKW